MNAGTAATTKGKKAPKRKGKKSKANGKANGKHAAPEAANENADVPRLSNREKERIAEAAQEAKERVFIASREELELQEELRRLRGDFGERMKAAKERLRETVESPHSGKPAEKVKLYDEIVMAWQDIDELIAERKSTLHPVLMDLEDARKRRVEGHAEVRQLVLQFD